MRKFMNWLYELDKSTVNRIYDGAVISTLIIACLWLFN